MPFDFINPFMLLGLSALSLPVVVHLLSRRKYDVVAWGAMQFLELHRRERRHLRLQELLLMLLRMALMALLVIALARPWTSGGPFAGTVVHGNRDIVLVVDGSYSMGWEGTAETPHAKAVQWIHRFLEELRPGDAVALIDARDRVHPVIETPTRDLSAVRRELDQLAPPAGASDLAEAIQQAVQLLSRATNDSREVIVLTDGQAHGWSPDDVQFWTGFDDLRKHAPVTPQIWVVDLSEPGSNPQSHANFAVDRLHVSRELAAAGFPLRVQTKIWSAGIGERATCRVSFEVDGQRLADKTREIHVPPEGEAHVEFEYRPSTLGSHVLSVVLEDDLLPGDNRSDAAISVVDALPVLLVDGTPHPDATRRETFFAQTALSAPSNDAPWIRATTVPWDVVEPGQMESFSVVVLANVPRLSETFCSALADFVRRGGGVLIALGDQVEPENYNHLLLESGPRLLPAALEAIESDTLHEFGGVHVVDGSLESPWIRRFRQANGGQLQDVRFTRWWRTNSDVIGVSHAEQTAAENEDDSVDSAPVLVARLDTGDPLLMERRYGRGRVLLMTSALDADWSTFPTKSDYVPFLHELLFHLTSGRTSRNVDAGAPLVLAVERELDVDEYAFLTPDGSQRNPQRAENDLQPLVRLDDAWLPGVYRFVRTADPALRAAFAGEAFVVNCDRAESDLTLLSESDRLALQRDGRMQFVRTHGEVQPTLPQSTARTELWRVLFLAFLVVLVGEVILTRRLVKGGHLSVEETEPHENSAISTSEEDSHPHRSQRAMT